MGKTESKIDHLIELQSSSTPKLEEAISGLHSELIQQVSSLRHQNENLMNKIAELQEENRLIKRDNEKHADRKWRNTRINNKIFMCFYPSRSFV